jgi:indolepyruvate ferredoxin oxidoreductase alpha subunit
MGEETHSLDLARLCEVIGAHVQVANPNDLKATEKALKEELAHNGPSVIVFRAPCVIRDRSVHKKPLKVIPEKCPACGLCFKIGCPAIIKDKEDRAVIDPLLCTGCNICAQVCRLDAIVKSE